MAENDSTLDISKLKVPDLKKELKSRGLNTTGNKNELVERLLAAMESKDRSVDEFEEDLLNEDDDDGHLETTESVISDIDTAFNDTLSVPTSPQKRKSDVDDKAPPPKKVILNRNIPTPVVDKRPSTESKEGSDKTNGSSDDKKVIKLSEISAKERLEMRAKKFDVPLTVDAKKMARAERFGSTNSQKRSSNDGISTKVDTSLDVLKQRAERFGVNVSTALSKLDNQERLEKRKARFGIVTDTDKAKQRLERFKQPVK